MAEEKKDGAEYIGNKVKVRLNKPRPDRRRRGSGDPSEKIHPAEPVSHEMLQPVDYRPPDEEKLRSIREAGFREGKKLSEEEKNAAGAPSGQDKQPGGAGSAPERREDRVNGYIGKGSRPAARVSGIYTENGGAEDAAPKEETEEGSDRENTGSQSDVHLQAQTKERDQRKGRKKKKAERKAERRAEKKAADSASFAEPAKTEKNEAGKSTAQGTVPPQVSGQDALTGSGQKPEKTRVTVPRGIVMLLSGLFALYALSPLAVGVVTVGILPPLCIGSFFFAVALFWPKIRDCKKPWANALFVVCGAAVIAGITLIFYLFGLMYAASAVKPPAARSDYTVVVLGCKTIGSRPSLMLGDRLDAAAEFLKEHPGSYCVVSGGQGEDELAPESAVMKRYLVSKGISELRIVEENSSATTAENIGNSCAMLDEFNLYSDIVVVTDRFHQYRARHYVEKQGLRCYAVNSETRWYLAIHYWFKEMVAVGLMQLGYEV